MSQNQLPKIELCNETIIYKKVYSNYVLFTPVGTPSLLWINSSGSFLIQYNNKNNIEKKNISYNSSLSTNTIFYGIHFLFKNISFFAIEDILYYKGKNITYHCFSQKLNLINNILDKEIQQQPTSNPNDIILGLPIITSHDKLNIKMIEKIPYKIKYIQFRNLQKNNGNHRFQLPLQKYINLYNPIIEKIFMVNPDIQNDIYHLYIDDKYIDVAFIPDYKTSVFMNKIFRNIKENDNLDLLEESDNEEEEEVVYLDRKYKMNCKYNKKFNKWIPISLVDNNNI
jgi:hypothetical protein